MSSRYDDVVVVIFDSAVQAQPIAAEQMEAARGCADTERVPGGDVVLAVEHDGQRLIVCQTAIGNRLAAKLLDMHERKRAKVDIRSSGGQNVLGADAERQRPARNDRTRDRILR